MSTPTGGSAVVSIPVTEYTALRADSARLDWLEDQEIKRGSEVGITLADAPFLVLAEDGTTHWGETYREAIDSAMKEGTP